MVKLARDVMSADCQCIGEEESLLDAARKLAALDVGAMPICGTDGRLKGMITDRDLVVKAIAQGKNLTTTRAGELAEGRPITVDGDDSISDVVKTLAEYRIRRIPVLDGHNLIGIIAIADLAVHLPKDELGELMQMISTST
jgi:CBS domain-containing protein